MGEARQAPEERKQERLQDALDKPWTSWLPTASASRRAIAKCVPAMGRST